MELKDALIEIDRNLLRGVSRANVAVLIQTWGLNGQEQRVLEYLKNWKPKRDSRPQPFDWKSEIQTYEALRSENLPELKFTIDQMLTRPGLGVLSAIKKLGKSWLVLLMAIMVSSGEPFLGLKTQGTSVVYLALEDGKRRINQRLKIMKAPQIAPISFLYKFPALNSPAGRNQFLDMIKALKPGLIIIDTLASSKNALIDENDNAQMADLMNWFHQVSVEHDVTILIVAHHGKKSTGDPGFDIRGASAVPGATDMNMALYKNPGTGAVDLVVEGRDIPPLSLTIKLDESCFRWSLQGETKDIRRKEAEEKIIKAMDFLGGRAEVLDIARVADIDRSTAQYHLERMRGYSVDREEIKSEGKNKVLKYVYKIRTSADAVDDGQHEAGRARAVHAVDDITQNANLSSNIQPDNDGYWESLLNDQENFESEE